MQIFVEYVMLSNVNDGPEQAHELGKLVSHRPSQYMINLIPWNPVYSPDISFDAPDPSRIESFSDILRSYNLHCTIRREMGQDISGKLNAAFFWILLLTTQANGEELEMSREVEKIILHKFGVDIVILVFRHHVRGSNLHHSVWMVPVSFYFLLLLCKSLATPLNQEDKRTGRPNLTFLLVWIYHSPKRNCWRDFGLLLCVKNSTSSV